MRCGVKRPRARAQRAGGGRFTDGRRAGSVEVPPAGSRSRRCCCASRSAGRSGPKPALVRRSDGPPRACRARARVIGTQAPLGRRLSRRVAAQQPHRARLDRRLYQFRVASSEGTVVGDRTRTPETADPGPGTVSAVSMAGYSLAMRKVAFAVAGFALIAVGFASVLLPAPGVVLIGLGLAILAREFLWAKRLLAWSRDHARRSRTNVRERSARLARAFRHGPVSDPLN